MGPKAKKELIQTAPVSKNAQLLARLSANSSSVMSCAASMRSWRYIDFYNPLAKMPCITLEWLFGARGLLAGRILQLRATYSKGKSSFMYLQYAASQALANAFCFHIETEGASAPPDYVASFGANPEDLMIAELTSLEECLEQIDDIICQIRGGFGGSVNAEGRQIKTKYDDPIDAQKENPLVIGVDSLSSLGIRSRVDTDVIDADATSQISYHSNKLRGFFRDRVGRLRDTHTLLMIASHETAKIETGFKKAFGAGGDKKTALGQEAIGIHGTYGVDLDIRAWTDKEAGVRKGDIVTMSTFKNKLSPRGRRAELYLVSAQGFDLVHTDVEFLMTNPNSPFTKDELYRHSKGITCKPLSDKSFPNEEEFLRSFYGNADLLAACREKMRIRGLGFEFEKKYTIQELPDDKEDFDGVAGSQTAVP